MTKSQSLIERLRGRAAYFRKEYPRGDTSALLDEAAAALEQYSSASCDTHPQDGDGEATAPLVSGTVPTADAQTGGPNA